MPFMRKQSSEILSVWLLSDFCACYAHLWQLRLTAGISVGMNSFDKNITVSMPIAAVSPRTAFELDANATATDLMH